MLSGPEIIAPFLENAKAQPPPPLQRPTCEVGPEPRSGNPRHDAGPWAKRLRRARPSFPGGATPDAGPWPPGFPARHPSACSSRPVAWKPAPGAPASGSQRPAPHATRKGTIDSPPREARHSAQLSLSPPSAPRRPRRENSSQRTGDARSHRGEPNSQRHRILRRDLAGIIVHNERRRTQVPRNSVPTPQRRVGCLERARRFQASANRLAPWHRR